MLWTGSKFLAFLKFRISVHAKLKKKIYTYSNWKLWQLFCFKDCKYFFSLFETNQIKHFKMPLWLFYDCEIGAQSMYALSFYGSKIMLDQPNNFGRVPIVLDGSNLFWSGPNHFGQVQIIKISPKKSNLNLTKIIWTRTKQFVLVQNNLVSPKSFWTNRRTRH